MKDFLKRSLSTVFGAVSYPLLSLWLNLIDFSTLLIGIIGFPAYKGFTWFYQQESGYYNDQRMVLGTVGAALGLVAGITVGAIALPLMVLMTAYDFLHNLVIGTKAGYQENISSIWQTIASNWKPFQFLKNTHNRAYNFTSLISLSIWQEPSPEEGNNHDSEPAVYNIDPEGLMANTISNDFLTLMQSPTILYELLCTSFINDNQVEVDLNSISELAHRNVSLHYIRAYFSGRYDLVQSYIGAFPARKRIIQESLFLTCVEVHLLSHEEYLEHFLSQNPSYRQRAEDLIKERERKRNAFVKLKQIDFFPNNKLNEEELQNAKTVGTKLMKTMLEQYDNLMERLEATDDQLMTGMDFEDEEIILFSKQYLDQESSNWLAVPAATQKTTQGHIESWFTKNLSHPLTRDNVIDPKTYTNRPTRYVWYRYDVSKNDGCQLLNQLSDLIRSNMKEQLTPELVEASHTINAPTVP